MKSTTASTLAFLLGGAAPVLGSCTPNVYSPPARMAPLESATTLAPGETGVQIEGADHGGILGPNGESGTIRVRRGVYPDLEVSAEMSVLHIDGTSAAMTDPLVFAGRAGVKYRLLPFLSLTGGVGGGSSAGGGFVSPDLGLILAWENPYLVPFLSVRGSFSLPVAANAVDTTPAGQPIGTDVFLPTLTEVAAGTVGVRVPIGWCRPAPCPVRGSVLAGVGLTNLWTTSLSTSGAPAGPVQQGFATAAGGAELVF